MLIFFWTSPLTFFSRSSVALGSDGAKAEVDNVTGSVSDSSVVQQSRATGNRRGIKRRREESTILPYSSSGAGTSSSAGLSSFAFRFASSRAPNLQHRENRSDVSLRSVANVPRWLV